METIISDKESDLLKEIINISIAKAADTFAALSGDQVFISVPELKFLKSEDCLAKVISEKAGRIIIQNEIKGDLQGLSLSIFSDIHIEKIKQIADVELITTEFSVDKDLPRMLSKVINDSLVTQLAGILQMNIYTTLPLEPIYADEVDLNVLKVNIDSNRPFIITINTKFIDHKDELELPLMLIFDLENMGKILQIIRKNNYRDILLAKERASVQS